MPTPKKRKSVIRKRLTRNLNTARFEQLEVSVEVEEEVEWATLRERDEKVANWSKVLLRDFTQTINEACGVLGVQHKAACVYDPRTDKGNGLEDGEEHELDMVSAGKGVDALKEDGADVDLDGLDSLD